jgi:hypothetical protein
VEKDRQTSFLNGGETRHKVQSTCNMCRHRKRKTRNSYARRPSKRARAYGNGACARVLPPPPRPPASVPARCIGAPPPPPRHRWQPAAGACSPPPRPRQLVRLPELAGAMRQMGGLRLAAPQRLDAANTCWVGCGRVHDQDAAAPARPGRARAAPAGASAGLKWRRQRLSRGCPASLRARACLLIQERSPGCAEVARGGALPC